MSDPGDESATTAAERTALSWERTGIALAATGALVLHLAPVSRTHDVVGVLLLALATAVVLVVGPSRYRGVDPGAGATAPVRWGALAVTAVVCLTAVGVGVHAVGVAVGG